MPLMVIAPNGYGIVHNHEEGTRLKLMKAITYLGKDESSLVLGAQSAGTIVAKLNGK
jgi:hypothetical protein